MDQATQQNAALVEEMAAAASSLKSQAQDLVQVVATFKLGEGEAPRTGFAPQASQPRPGAQVGKARRTALSQPRPAPKQVTAFKPASKPAAKPAAIAHQVSPKDDDAWETF
jgi:hypothetical protein